MRVHGLPFSFGGLHTTEARASSRRVFCGLCFFLQVILFLLYFPGFSHLSSPSKKVGTTLAKLEAFFIVEEKVTS